MKNIDSKGHVTGKSLYLDDIPVRQGTLHAVVFFSPVAHAKIKNLEVTDARNYPGVIDILTAKDIPGENQIGGIIPDEPLFAEYETDYLGQPVALVVAETERIARRARQLIKLDFDELEVITDPRVATEKGWLLTPPTIFSMGEPEKKWSHCKYIFEGSVEQAGQEHLYLETQGAYSYPAEDGRIMVHSSTQSPTAAQRTIAKVLGISMNQIQVDVVRLGGGFGGKEDQATAPAVMVALAAQKLEKPVKLVLSRADDMQITGKRHPYSSDFKIGLSQDLKILAYEVTYYQNGGASNDLSPAISQRTLFHTTNSYYIPDVKATLYSCKTNLPPNTAFRGFGAPQGMFVIESAIAKAAMELHVPASLIQKRNLLRENDLFYYGQTAKQVNIRKTWKTLCDEYHLQEKQKEIESFNKKNRIYKKGMAMMPVTFGISFTNISMNQARALVHIYHDGSIGVSTGAIEMGQGVNTKMMQVAAHTFSIDPSRIKLETTNTSRVSNTSPTAASSGADLNGNALLVACNALLMRLKAFVAEQLKASKKEVEIVNERVFVKGNETDFTWEKLIRQAFLNRVNLTEHGHYATPVIHFDVEKGKGHPFAYHTYGTAAFVVKVDVLRGIYEVEEVDIVHDFGDSMNQSIDIGQVEGALVQGIGYMTMEELSYNSDGKLLSNSLSTYKVPDIYGVPKTVNVMPLKTSGHTLAVMGSKAVGEPPLLYGLGVYFAIQNAMREFNPQFASFDAPMTPEKVLMGLYPRSKSVPETTKSEKQLLKTE
ncbi:MAG: molybdopterin-dependent oxidoreductase [Bacteroidales bacterium]|nr:molybdopterin-dependent oxidoreductase [Bacteroidales bacterium]